MTAAELNVRPGEILAGKYAVERVLGQGGMGAVLAVRHLMLDELRALKLMLPSAMGGHQAVERFVREARAAARLKSEHVTRVHDVGLLPTGQPYIEMELLEGEDLATTLQRRGPLAPSEVISWMLQVCDALQEAHAAGVVHRDLKPANLFIARRPNGGECVKVLDFGVAKVQDGQDTSLTSTGTALGSPLYMSPEQMYGATHAEPRSDLWSLGVIMFQLLTGSVPFNGASVTAVALAVVNTPTPSPTVHRADLPPALDSIVMRCLQKAPAARFADARELAAALRAARDGVPFATPEPLGAPAPSTRLPAPSLSGSSNAASTVALPPTPGAMPAPALVGPHASTFDTPVSIMPRPQPKRRMVVPVLAVLSVAAVVLVVAAVFMARSPAKSPSAARSSDDGAKATAVAGASAIPTSTQLVIASGVATSDPGASAVADVPGPSAAPKASASSKASTTLASSPPQSSAKRPDAPTTARTATTATAPKKGGGFTGVD